MFPHRVFFALPSGNKKRPGVPVWYISAIFSSHLFLAVFFLVDFLALFFFALFFLALFFFAVFLALFFFGAGTLAPFFLASDNPIAIACLRLFTFLPLLPLRNVPFFLRCIALSTVFCDFFEYLAIIIDYRYRSAKSYATAQQQKDNVDTLPHTHAMMIM